MFKQTPKVRLFALQPLIGPKDGMTFSGNTVFLYRTTGNYNLVTMTTSGGSNQIAWWVCFGLRDPIWAPLM